MPEEKKAEETVDTAKTKSTEEGESTEAKTIAEEVADVTDVAESETPAEEAETSEPLAEPLKEEPTAEETDEATTEEVEDEEPSSFLEDATSRKSGLEKRVDKLTAEKYQKEAEIAKLQAQVEIYEKTSPDAKTKRYTSEQLASAMMRAHEDGDKALMTEIFEQQGKQIKDDLRADYDREQKNQREENTRIRQEWTQVQKNWEYLGDAEQAELYPNSRKELDIRSAQSLLRKVALYLYNSEQEDMFQRYHRPGGQGLAVQDAFKQILKKRRGTTSDTKETKTLKKRLTKERRKKSLAGGSKSVKTDASPKTRKALTKAERVLEYVKERNQTRDDAIAKSLK